MHFHIIPISWKDSSPTPSRCFGLQPVQVAVWILHLRSLKGRHSLKNIQLTHTPWLFFIQHKTPDGSRCGQARRCSRKCSVPHRQTGDFQASQRCGCSGHLAKPPAICRWHLSWEELLRHQWRTHCACSCCEIWLYRCWSELHSLAGHFQLPLGSTKSFLCVSSRHQHFPAGCVSPDIGAFAIPHPHICHRSTGEICVRPKSCSTESQVSGLAGGPSLAGVCSYLHTELDSFAKN